MTPSAASLDDLDGHDGVGALGNGAAGGDRHRLAAPSGRRGTRRRRSAPTTERHGRASVSAERNAKPSIAELANGGRSTVAAARLGQYAPGRALDRHALGLERLRPIEDEALRLGDGDQSSHDGVP